AAAAGAALRSQGRDIHRVGRRPVRRRRGRYASGSAHPVIDVDIHPTVPSVEALFPYLSEHWREYIRTSAFKGPVDTAYPPRAPTTLAPGAPPPDGSLAQIQTQVLDPWRVEIGILNCAYGVDSLH